MPKHKDSETLWVLKPSFRSVYAGDNTETYYRQRYEYVDNVLLVPLENDVFFPYMLIGQTVSHPQAIASIKKAYRDSEFIFLFLASDSLPDDVKYAEIEDVYDSVGALGLVKEVFDNPDGSLSYNAVLSHKGRIITLTRRSPYMRGKVECLFPTLIDPTPEEVALGEKLDKLYLSMSRFLSESDRNQLNETL